MKIEINAIGLPCPQPVIKTKKELDKLDTGIIVTIVDNDIAKENILKLANSNSLETNAYEKEGNFYIEIFKNKDAVNFEQVDKQDNLKDEMILITSEFMGKGNDELGKVLMKGFLYTLSETIPYPKCIAFVNSAIKLTSINEETIQSLNTLKDNGCEIVSCGTCLDYFNLKNDLKVGTISNMYDIVDKLKNISKVISI